MSLSLDSGEVNEEQNREPIPLPEYKHILIGVDASDHSNRGIQDVLVIGKIFQSTITGAHVYAAKMHDVRFRQMEGGLPDQYKEEEELEKQRDIHDDLITKGLSVITDSYLDQVDTLCEQSLLSYKRQSLEGKNYRELVREANSGDYDLLVMGSLGLGAVLSSRIGTVCERVTRRSDIDVLVIKNPNRPVSEGPIVVAVDGSTRAYGGLLTGLSLAKKWQIPLHVVSAYDPYYHYVAFNRIAGILSEEAGKIFRFKEQAQLHEDIIDAGLARIYQGHLDIARSIAAEYDVAVTTTLLDGKPYEIIREHLDKVDPSLLIVGKLGIHADDTLDIGGQAENLLRNVSCAVLLSQRTFTPAIEKVAESTTSWTRQAEKRMQDVPEFARNIARLGVLRYALEQGHTVITERIVAKATETLCPVNPGRGEAEDDLDPQINLAGKRKTMTTPEWSEAAQTLLETVVDRTQKNAIRIKAEKKARQQGARQIEIPHLESFMTTRVSVASAETSEENKSGATGKCPFPSDSNQTGREDENLRWTDGARQMLAKVPQGFTRNLTRARMETYARKNGCSTITPEVIRQKYAEWGKGSDSQQRTMRWDQQALERLEKIPPFIRGMVMKEMELCARDSKAGTVTTQIMDKAGSVWASSSKFHSSHNPNQYKD